MKKILLTLLFTVASLDIADVFASDLEEIQTIPYSFKAGAGRPGEEHPNGTRPHVSKYQVPCLDGKNRYDLSQWINRGGGHYVAALPSINMTPTNMIFFEWLQLALLSQINSVGKMSIEKTVYTQALQAFDEILADDKTYAPVTETYTVMHLYMPADSDRLDGAGAVLGLEGSKGVRVTALQKGNTYKEQGIPYLVPDFIGTAASASTVENQLNVSFFGRALTILMAHEFLQGLHGVTPEKIVWDAESIGATQALVALLPEVVEKFGDSFTPPAYLALNDFAPTLTSPRLEESFFWKIPKTIWGGEQDHFTPLSQVRSFLGEHLNNHLTTVNTHSGHHDGRSLKVDTLHQAGGRYTIEKATNYTGFRAFVATPIDDIRASLAALSNPDTNDILNILMSAFGNLKLNLMGAGLQVISDRIHRSGDAQKIAQFENLIGTAPFPEHLPLGPEKVYKTLKFLGKGATFGPESAGKARELQQEVVKDVLMHVR